MSSLKYTVVSSPHSLFALYHLRFVVNKPVLQKAQFFRDTNMLILESSCGEGRLVFTHSNMRQRSAVSKNWGFLSDCTFINFLACKYGMHERKLRHASHPV